jgi:ATP-dependent helicase IRC3
VFLAIKYVNPTATIAFENAEEQADVINSDIILASVASLGREGSTRLQKYNPALFKMIVVDEAHHCTAPTYLRILDQLNARNEESHIFLWGCTATVNRYDGIELNQVFQRISYHKEVKF